MPKTCVVHCFFRLCLQSIKSETQPLAFQDGSPECSEPLGPSELGPVGTARLSGLGQLSSKECFTYLGPRTILESMSRDIGLSHKLTPSARVRQAGLLARTAQVSQDSRVSCVSRISVLQSRGEEQSSST